MKDKGFWRFVLIVLFAYVFVTWGTAFVHRDNWQYSGDFQTEGCLVLKLAAASLLYLFCTKLQGSSGFLEKLGMLIMMVGTAGLFYSIYKNVAKATINPFGFKVMLGNAIVTTAGLLVVAIMTRIVLGPNNSSSGGSFFSELE